MYDANERNIVHPSTNAYLHRCSNDTARWEANGSEYFDIRNISGNGTIIFSPSSSCQTVLGIKSVTGNFNNGDLEGYGRLIFNNEWVTIGNFDRGILHGVVRTFRCKFGPCDLFENLAWSKPTHLSEVNLSITILYCLFSHS